MRYMLRDDMSLYGLRYDVLLRVVCRYDDIDRGYVIGACCALLRDFDAFSARAFC